MICRSLPYQRRFITGDLLHRSCSCRLAAAGRNITTRSLYSNSLQRPQWSSKRLLLLSGLAGGLAALCAAGGTAPAQQLRRLMYGFASPMHQSQAALVQALVHEERITSQRVAAAMAALDRRHFLNPDDPELFPNAYVDHPLPIGKEQTISAPHMHAAALQLLEQQAGPGASVLDVGSGSGYLTGAFGLLVGDSGRVLGVEQHQELADRSRASLQWAIPDLMKRGTVQILPGNALGRALEEYGPFDAIHVGAAAAVLPQTLINKLKPGGRMVIPVGGQTDDYQVLQLVDKAQDGSVAITDLMPVRFVPLVPEKQNREL